MNLCLRFLFFLFLILDVVSKLAVVAWVSPISQSTYPFGGIGIFADFLGVSFSLNMVTNTGAVWGIFPDHPTLLFAIRILVICALIFYLLFSKRNIRSQDKKSLWLVVVGAIGNAIDYALYGSVIDFFHFNFWGYSFPVFNLADTYISLGVIFLAVFGSLKKSVVLPAL